MGEKASLNQCGQQHRYKNDPASKEKFAKKTIFFACQSYTLHEQNFSNLRALLFITFLQRFQISKKFGHWISGSGGKKTFKRSEKMKKISVKNFFGRGDFRPFLRQKCSNLIPFLSNTFPQGFRIPKQFGYQTLGSGGKKMFKRYLKK